MRIAIINWSRRRIAGTETYLNRIIPELHQRRHQIAFFSELDEPLDREQIEIPDESPSWCVAEVGQEPALTALAAWKPDVIYAHGLNDPALEAATIRLAPSVLFAHSYYGTCISGAKTFKFPVVQPCARKFGWQCLLQFYPRRCGGLNPMTMWQQYQTQSKRLELLRQYKTIIVFSEHMRKEYIKHGLSPQLAHDSLHEVEPSTIRSNETDHLRHKQADQSSEATKMAVRRLVFLGRMESLKGGQVFLKALSQLNGRIDRPIEVIFAGDGPDRAAWERRAEGLQGPSLSISFTGWLNEPAVNQLLENSDLLVLPSLWPEPFGLAVLEAGQRGVPVAAFAVGGIPHWLIDGVNGHLAPGNPPRAAGLAEAICRCLSDPDHLQRLRAGAVEMASRFTIEAHVKMLEETFEKIARSGFASKVGKADE